MTVPQPPAAAAAAVSAPVTAGAALDAPAVAQPATDVEALERQIEEALQCPCVADLKASSCGPTFSAAFACFARAQQQQAGAGGSGDVAEAAAAGCMAGFNALHECMNKSPAEFAHLFAPGKDEPSLQEAAASRWAVR